MAFRAILVGKLTDEQKLQVWRFGYELQVRWLTLLKADQPMIDDVQAKLGAIERTKSIVPADLRKFRMPNDLRECASRLDMQDPQNVQILQAISPKFQPGAPNDNAYTRGYDVIEEYKRLVLEAQDNIMASGGAPPAAVQLVAVPPEGESKADPHNRLEAAPAQPLIQQTPVQPQPPSAPAKAASHNKAILVIILLAIFVVVSGSFLAPSSRGFVVDSTLEEKGIHVSNELQSALYFAYSDKRPMRDFEQKMQKQGLFIGDSSTQPIEEPHVLVKLKIDEQIVYPKITPLIMLRAAEFIHNTYLHEAGLFVKSALHNIKGLDYALETIGKCQQSVDALSALLRQFHGNDALLLSTKYSIEITQRKLDELSTTLGYFDGIFC